ncbi:Patatin-like protein 7 [Linum perenne]
MAMLQTLKRGNKIGDLIEATEGKLEHKNVESVLFKGKKMGENTNLEKLEWFSGVVIKEEGKRKRSVLQAVVLKQAATPRSSSATTISTLSSSC